MGLLICEEVLSQVQALARSGARVGRHPRTVVGEALVLGGRQLMIHQTTTIELAELDDRHAPLGQAVDARGKLEVSRGGGRSRSWRRGRRSQGTRHRGSICSTRVVVGHLHRPHRAILIHLQHSVQARALRQLCSALALLVRQTETILHAHCVPLTICLKKSPLAAELVHRLVVDLGDLTREEGLEQDVVAGLLLGGGEASCDPLPLLHHRRQGHRRRRWRSCWGKASCLARGLGVGHVAHSHTHRRNVAQRGWSQHRLVPRSTLSCKRKLSKTRMCLHSYTCNCSTVPTLVKRKQHIWAVNRLLTLHKTPNQKGRGLQP